MRNVNRKYLAAVGIVVGLPVLQLVLSPQYKWLKLSDSILNAVIIPVGMLIGTLTFRAMADPSMRFGMRIASAAVSGFFGVLAGLLVASTVGISAFDALALGPHPNADYTGFEYLSIQLSGAMYTGFVAFIFGFGPGLSAKREDTDSGELVDNQQPQA